MKFKKADEQEGPGGDNQEEDFQESMQSVQQHKGALHQMLGVQQGQKIPIDRLRRAAKAKSVIERKRAQFALNASKWNH